MTAAVLALSIISGSSCLVSSRRLLFLLCLFSAVLCRSISAAAAPNVVASKGITEEDHYQSYYHYDYVFPTDGLALRSKTSITTSDSVDDGFRPLCTIASVT
jgi:hypothetical protein